MSDFLLASACRGHRPSGAFSHRHTSRPHLVAKLLRERHVARFIVGPCGFGKTAVAYEYAEVIFSFEHVFWINAQSPCFLRDLDSCELDSRLLALDEHPFLVVFEDIPHLENRRVELFSEVIDRLLDAGKEVIVTCAPSIDVYAERHRARTKIGPNELLLSDEEVKALLLSAGSVVDSKKTPRSIERIPCLCWGSENESALLLGIGHEELPSDIILALFVMVVLQQGSFDDLKMFLCSHEISEVLVFLETNYPFLGIDLHEECYETVMFPVELLGRIFSDRFDLLAKHSLFRKRDTLSCRFADALLSRFQGERACLFVSLFASKSACATWLASRSYDLMKIACIQPAHELYNKLGRLRGEQRLILGVAQAWRHVVLGDEATALLLAKRVAVSDKASEEERGFALLLIFRYGSSEAQGKAQKTLVALQNAAMSGSIVGRGMTVPDRELLGTEWVPLVSVALGLHESIDVGIKEWHRWESAGASEQVLLLSSVFVLEDLLRYVTQNTLSEPTPVPLTASLKKMEHVVYDYNNKKLDEMDLFAATAGALLEKLGECNVCLGKSPLPTLALLRIRRMEMMLFSQRKTYLHSVKKLLDSKQEYEATHPAVFQSHRFVPPHLLEESVSNAPLLRVSLFGGLEVRIGDTAVDLRKFKRQKAKTLLALLVLNKGREVSRDRLVQQLWPESDIETARKNFYSVWSQLRHTLTTRTGACPYLIRDQNGCKLDARLLSSDVTQIESLCRDLLFGRLESDGWKDLFTQANEMFSDELLPSENDNDFIVRRRDEYRIRLVDALVAASRRLAKAGELNGSLWFAREALKHDTTREDAYIALMEAQIAAEQRTAALETYFACRRNLVEELGIDPSPQTVRLYHSIIETEEVLDW